MERDLTTQRISPEQFDQVETVYDRILHTHMRNAVAPHLAVSRLLQRPLVDLGCGTGSLAAQLVKHERCGGGVFLVDSNEDYLRVAADRVGKCTRYAVVPTLGDLLDPDTYIQLGERIRRGTVFPPAVLFSNVSGYFSRAELKAIFCNVRRHLDPAVIVMNLMVHEDNQDPILHSKSLVSVTGTTYKWDLGFDFELTALTEAEYTSLLASITGYSVNSMWVYSDFKVERLVVLVNNREL